MADPVVHITNGIPDSGTGNITTLGQVLAAIQSLAGSLFAKITDGTNTAAVKAASTLPAVTDPALVVTIRDQNNNGSTIDSNSTPVAWSTEGKAQVGSLTETAPTTDTASSGLNGRLQRIAQRLTTLLLPSATANGLTASRVNVTASNNLTSLKASAGQIYSIDVFNVAAYTVFLKLYNKASAPVVASDTPVWTIPIQAGGGYSKTFPAGKSFATGIAYAVVKLQADTDATNVVAGDLTGEIEWI